MSDENNDVRRLQLQEERKAAARAKLKRLAMETVALTPDVTLEGCKILAVPLIRGVNLERTGTGFGDVQACQVSAFGGNGHSFSEYDDHLILTKMVEIFNGLLLQKVVGTPSLLNTSLTEKDVVTVEEEKTADPEAWAKIQSVLRLAYAGEDSVLRSGFFCPRFAGFWKAFHAPCKRRNYFNLQAVEGKKRYAKNVAGLLKPRNQKKKAPGGPNEPQKSGGEKNKGGDDDDDDDEDDADDDCGRGGTLLGEVFSTERSRSMKAAESASKEKIHVFLYRIFRKKRDRNFVAPLPRTRPLPKVARVRSPLEDDGVDDCGADDISAITAKVKTMNVAGADVAAALESYENSLFSKVGSEDDDDDDSDMFSSSSSLDGGNAKSPDDDDDDDAPTRPSSPDPFTTKSAANAKTLALDVELQLPPPIVLDSPSPSYLPFRDHSGNQAAGDNSYDRYYRYELAREGSAQNLYGDAGGDFDPRNYEVFGRVLGSATGCKNGDDVDLDVDAEDMGCVLIALVVDPNWDPNVALMTMCKNRTVHQLSANERSRALKKPGFFNPFLCDWSYETNGSHLSKTGFKEAEWNSWAKSYSVGRSSGGNSCGNRFDNCPVDPSSLTRPNLPPVFLSSEKNQSGGGGAGSSPAPDMSIAGAYSCDVLTGGASIEDPEDVFSLKNAVSWIEAYEGDADRLKFSVSETVVTGRPDSLFQPLLTSAAPSASSAAGHGKIVRCEFDRYPRHFYRIPYHRWSWPREKFAGLTKYFFPWCQDPVMSFLKHDVLGLKRSCLVEDKPLEYVVPVNVAENPESGRMEVKEHHVPSGVDVRSASLKKSRWRNVDVAENGSLQGFDLDQMDLPDRTTVQNIVEMHKNPGRGTFSTQLEADEVNDALNSALERKNGKLSPASKLNSLLMLQERFLPAYEMTLAEKPRETLAAPFISDSRSAMNSGATARWFRDDNHGVSPGGGGGGRRNPFVRQFKRYVVLRERFEDLACRQLDSVLHDKNTILTDTVQALVGYEEKKIDAANFKYSCYDLASDAFSNHLDKLALEVRFLMNIAHTTHHFVLVMLAMYDATRFDFGLHFHILNSGPGSTGKSYTSEALLDCLVTGTVTKADDTTARAFNVEKDLSDAISFIDEMNKKSQDGGGGGRGNNKSGDAGDPQAAMLRRMLSGGQLVLAEHVWVELPNGKRVRSRREVVTSCQGCIMGNLNEENFSEATLTRFYRAVFSKTNIRFSNAVWTDMNRSDYHAFMTLFLNRVASGRSVSDLAHLARVEDVRAMVASEALTMSYLRKEQESSQLRKESLEDLDVDNNLLSKMGDLLTTKFLPVVNVPQAMFLENLVGEADSPMSKDNAPRKLTDKVRLTQVLITYVWKMIQEKALPDVNLTLAHMVAQKYFAALKRYANVELANYRVYSRIMIMCRIVAVLDNLLQLFAVDGCDVPPGQRFCLGLLKGLKPYMFCNTKHTVFALTLLADEYIGPHDSTIMTMFGKCCRFSDKAVSDELKSFRELNSVLNELKQVHTVDGLENALIDLVSEEQDPLKRAKLEGILSSKEVPPPLPPPVPLLASTKETPAKECDSVPASATAPKVKAKNGPLFVVSKKATSATVYDNDENDDDHDDPGCDPTSPAVPTVSLPTKSPPKNYDGHCHAELKKMIRRILNNELMPHEIYLVQAVLPSIQIQWDTESYEKVEDSELRDGGGGGGGGSMASTAASSFPKPSSSSSSSHNKALAVNLNGLVDHCSKWTLVNKIRSFMLGAGPSPQDVGRTLDALGTRAIVVPWSYKKPFSALEIGKMAGKTPEELEKEGFLVRNRSYPLCNLSVYGRCTVNFYALNGLLDPLAVIMKGLDSLIYRGMKPARYELGIMVDPNRGKFAWWDVTQKMIDSSPHRTFDIRTGSYMTPKEKYVVFEKRTPEKDRIEKEIALSDLEAALSLMQEKLRNAVSAEERSVRHFLNDAARSSLSSAPTVEDAQPSVRDVQASVYLARSRLEEEDAKGDPDEDGTLDAIRDASEWFLTPTGRKSSSTSSVNHKFDADADPSSGAGFAHGQDVLRISADLDEWVAVRHFLNVGVPFGPHPEDEEKLCWYYRPVRVFSYLTGDCRYDDRYLEYRDFPTAYNQQMRSIFHLYTKSPLRYADMKSKGFVDEAWTCQALKHFEWLIPGANTSPSHANDGVPAVSPSFLSAAGTITTTSTTTTSTTTTSTTTTSTTSDELSDSPSRSSTSPSLKRKVDGDGMEVDSNPVPPKQPKLTGRFRERQKKGESDSQRSSNRDASDSFFKSRVRADGKF